MKTKNNFQETLAHEIGTSIIKRNLPIIFILLVIQILVVYFLKDNATLIAISSGVIGGAITQLFNERLTVLNFFYGSSIGSKLKDLQKENQENQTPQELQEKTEDSENTEPHFKTDKSKTDKIDLKDVKYQKK